MLGAVQRQHDRVHGDGNIVHTVIGDGAVHIDKWTPVCDACATPKELAKATTQSACAVCGQRMIALPHRGSSVRSSRCYQRQNRARRRSLAKATCTTCGLGFVPKRKDACFCSDACRQRAYRGRAGQGGREAQEGELTAD